MDKLRCDIVEAHRCDSWRIDGRCICSCIKINAQVTDIVAASVLYVRIVFGRQVEEGTLQAHCCLYKYSLGRRT